jgi:hypothetical protein
MTELLQIPFYRESIPGTQVVGPCPSPVFIPARVPMTGATGEELSVPGSSGEIRLGIVPV